MAEVSDDEVEAEEEVGAGFPATLSNDNHESSQTSIYPQNFFKSNKEHLMKKRVKYLWSVVRNHFVKKIGKIDVLSALTAPYNLSIKHGFVLRHTMELKHPLKFVLHHQRMIVHAESGRVHLQNAEQEAEVCKDDTGKNNSLTTVIKQNAIWTFGIVDRIGVVNIWDLGTNGATTKPKQHHKLETELTQVVLLEKFGMYASCSNENWIKFLNSKFEFKSTTQTPHTVQMIKYNKFNSELIALGSHDISILTLTGQMQRGGIKINATIKLQIITNFPSDRWITNVAINKTGSMIYAAIEQSVLSFDGLTGEKLDILDCKTKRHISCLYYFESMNYIIVGCSDGKVKVFNSSKDLVQEFTSHSKTVTSIIGFQKANLFLSCSLDMTVRMYSLSSYKEIYCLNLKERPLGMNILDDRNFYIFNQKSVTIWNLNHINSVFLLTNSPVKRLNAFKSKNFNQKVLIRTDDGIIRLATPSTGKTLTTTLPLLETDIIVDLAFCAKINKLFLVLEKGELWTLSTKINPCQVIDIWHPRSFDREDCKCILIVEGTFTVPRNSTSNLLDKDIVKGYCILLGATSNGQVIVYSHHGFVRYRSQIHSSPIIQMIANERQELLITSGTDKCIKISTISPIKSEIIELIIVIHANFIPRLLAVMDNHVMATGDDFVLRLYNFDLQKNKSCEIIGHLRSDDHGESLTNISANPKLGLFVTASKDGFIKVWDTNNILIREIQFQEPIESMCINRHSDIIFGLQGRVDIIRSKFYLPPGYLEKLNKFVDDDAMLEDEAIPFQQFLDANQWMKKHKPKTKCKFMKDLDLSEPNLNKEVVEIVVEDILNKNETVDTDVGDASENEGNTEKMAEDIMMEKYTEADTETNLKEPIIQNNDLILFDDFEEGSLKDIEYEMDFKKFVKYNWRRELEEEELVLKSTLELISPHSPTDIKPVVTDPIFEKLELEKKLKTLAIQKKLDEDLMGMKKYKASLIVNNVSIAISRMMAKYDSSSNLSEDNVPVEAEETVAEYTGNLEEVVNGPPSGASQVTEEESIRADVGNNPVKKRLRKPTDLMIAPDGFVPNSRVKGKVTKWESLHQNFATNTNKVMSQSYSLKKKEAKNVASVDNERNKKKDEYKLKLQNLLNNIKEEKEKEKRIEEQEHQLQQQKLLEEEKLSAERQINNVNKFIGQLMNNGKLDDKKLHEKNINAPKQVLTPPVQKFPRIIEMAQEIVWFPVDEIITEVEYEENSPYAGSKYLKLKVIPTADALLPFAMKVFSSTSTNINTKLDVLNYFSNVSDKYGYNDTQLIVNGIMEYLLLGLANSWEKQEIDFRKVLLENLVKFGAINFEVLSILLLYLVLGYDELKEISFTLLQFLGVRNPKSDFITAKFEDIYCQYINKCTINSFVFPTFVNQIKDKVESRRQSLAVIQLSKQIQDEIKEEEAIKEVDELTDQLNESLLKPKSYETSSSSQIIKLDMIQFLRQNLKTYLISHSSDKDTIEALQNLTPFGNEIRKKSSGTKKNLATDAKTNQDANYAESFNTKIHVGDIIKNETFREGNFQPRRNISKVKPHKKFKDMVILSKKKLVEFHMEGDLDLDVSIPTTAESRERDSNRNAIEILKNPSSFDIACALNYYEQRQERRMKRELELKDLAIKRAKEEEEARNKEAEFLVKQNEKAQKKLEELKKLEEVKLLREMRKKKKVEPPKCKFWGEGKQKTKDQHWTTHKSDCHESREAIGNFLKHSHSHSHDNLGNFSCKYMERFTQNQMTKLPANAFPIELVHLDIFDCPTQNKKTIKTLNPVNPPTFGHEKSIKEPFIKSFIGDDKLNWLASELDGTLSKKELDYIRNVMELYDNISSKDYHGAKMLKREKCRVANKKSLTSEYQRINIPKHQQENKLKVFNSFPISHNAVPKVVTEKQNTQRDQKKFIQLKTLNISSVAKIEGFNEIDVENLTDTMQKFASETAYCTYHSYSPQTPISNVACSDGNNGLVAKLSLDLHGDISSLYPYVTAFSGTSWNSPKCGQCMKLTSTINTVYLTIIDACGALSNNKNHFDIAPPAFYELFGPEGVSNGNGNVIYEEVVSTFCHGNTQQ
ncbi:hypothetical protein HDU92_000394 [Lobulomyces angularis]|nr:hypothetical protein HDU92_000394 [Lobulomyces angularis]